MLCAQDTTFTSSKTYDIEVWMPNQNKYVEISSCSNCTDFQARRMNAKYKLKNSKTKLFVHTLNGTGIAIERSIAAILENFFDGDCLHIPKALQSYMGTKKISVKKIKEV